MFLKRLETVGFKSFADRTTIEFVPGVTAVVGPNGSGKSNVIDAIRWVLGEQSARTLRGTKMEDIIFQGSDTRRALNFAEVSLILNNANYHLPVDYEEVNITRRVYRSGESEFYINKQACRLKDIIELFMDTGLGRESFSIIGQGKIDEILSSKAEERRAIFEEAAGVLKYKQRKQQAEAKLKDTASNLDRVEDIMHEIEQQLEPLKEQAEKAKLYQEKKASLQEVEVALLITEIEQLHEQWQTILKEMEKEKLEEADEKTAIQHKEAMIESKRSNIKALDETIQSLQGKLIEVTEKIEQLDGKRNVLLERAKHVTENKTKLIETETQTEEKIGDVKDKITREQEKLQSIRKTEKQIDTEINALKKQQDGQLENIESQIEHVKADYIEFLNEQAALNNEKHSLEEQINQIEKRKSIQTDSSKQFIDEQTKYKAAKEQLEQTLTTHENLLQEKETAYDSHLQTIKTMQAEETRMQQKLYEGNEKIASLESKMDVLKDMKESFQGYFFGVKETLQANKRGLFPHVEGVVLDLMDVPTKFMTAIDTILGAQAQHVVVQDDKAAREVIEWLKQENKGRATFLPLRSIERRSIPTNIVKQITNEAGFIGIASELISTADNYRLVMEHLMGNAIVVENLQSATNIAKKVNRRYRVVTLDGDIVYPGGSMSGGAKKKNNFSLFTREKELKTLEQTVQSFLERKDAFLQKLATHQKSLQEKMNESATMTESIKEIKKAVQMYQKQMNELHMQEQKATDKLSTYRLYIDQFTKEKADLEAAKETNKERMALVSKKLQTATEKIDQLEAEARFIEQDEATTEKRLHELEIAHVEQRAKANNVHERIKELQKEESSLSEDLAQVTQQLKTLNNMTISEADEVSMDTQLKQWKDTREKMNLQLQDTQETRIKAVQFVEDEEKEIRGRYRVHDQFVQSIQKKEVQANRLDVALENRLNFLQAEYVMTYEYASEHYEKVTELEAAKTTVKQMKRSIDRLGTVNLGAIEECERLTERHTFLTEQQADLEEAKATLYEVIEEMDEEMTTRFETVFTAIQSAFTKVFKELFGGGHAKLELSDPSNLLETGIEIYAQPPGKKLRTLGLLSGGERALTAIALLFAILQTRPVPFVILDEVDAALDEANVVRFSKYLETYRDETQFIVITHRNGTMEVANVLYGITMQESGVSKLVSVKLEESKSLVKNM